MTDFVIDLLLECVRALIPDRIARIAAVIFLGACALAFAGVTGLVVYKMSTNWRGWIPPAIAVGLAALSALSGWLAVKTIRSEPEVKGGRKRRSR